MTPQTHPMPPLFSSAELPALHKARVPWAVRSLAIVLVGLFFVVAAGVWVVPWQQTFVGQGRVTGREPLERPQIVEAPVDGRISRVHVVEGARVRAGDVVVEIADVDPRFLDRLQTERDMVRLRQSAAEARVASIEERIQALKSARVMALSAAAARIDMAKERVRQAEETLSAAAAHQIAADKNLPRVRELADKGIRAARDLELAELDASRASADAKRSQAGLEAARAELTSIVAERTRVEKETLASIEDARGGEQVARAETAAARGEITRADTRVARQEMQEVRAPRDGVVLRVMTVEDGHLVKQGEPLVQIVPDVTSRAVELWIDGNDAPLVRPGRTVRLQFEGWPAIQFMGWPSVARGTFGGTVLLVDAHDDGEGKFRALVLPDGDDEPWPPQQQLRQGVRVHGWVLLDQVSMGFEIWRRLNGFPASVSQP